MQFLRPARRAALATSALVASLLALPGPVAAQDPVSPANSIAALVATAPVDGSSRDSALGLEVGGPRSATLRANSPVWFRIDVGRNAELVFDTEGSTCDTVLELYNANGDLVTRDDDGGTGVTSRIEHQVSAGRWFLRVRGFSETTSGEITCRANGAVGLGGDGRTRASAAQLRAGQAGGGRIAGGQSRWFRLEVESAGDWTLGSNGEGFHTILELCDTQGNPIAVSVGGLGDRDAAQIRRELQNGTYFLKVTSRGEGEGNFHVSAQAPAGVPTHTHELFAGYTLRTELAASTDLSVRFVAPERGVYAFSTAGSAFDTVLTLSQEGGARVAENDDAEGGTQSLIRRALDAGTYQLQVRGFSAAEEGALVLSAELVGAAPPAGQGDSAEHAIPAPLGQRLSGDYVSGEPRWFRVDLQRPARLRCTTQGSDFDTVLALFDGNGQELDRNDDVAGNTSSRIDATLPAGAWYLVLEGFGEAQGSYALQVEEQAAQQALELSVGGATRGELEPGEALLFDLHLDQAGEIVLGTEGSNFDTVLTLMDSSGNTLATDDDGGVETSSLLRQALDAGSYRVRLSGFSDTESGEFVLTAERGSTEGRIPVQAAPLSPGQRITDRLSSGTERWYRFELSARTRIQLPTAGSDFDTVLRLCDTSLEAIVQDDDGGENTDSLIERDLDPGTYLVCAQGFGDSSGQLVLSLQGSEPQSTQLPTRGEAHFFLAAGEELSFTYDAPQAAQYTFTTAGSAFDTVVRLTDAAGNEIANDDDGGEGTSSLIRMDLIAGRYTLHVRGFGGNSSGALAVQTDWAQTAVLIGSDSRGQSSDTPLQLSASAPATGHLQSSQELWFGFQLAQRDEIELSTEGSLFDTILHLHGAEGEELASDDDGGEGVTSRIRTTLDAGTYSVRLRGFNNAGGAYSLRLGQVEPTPTDGTLRLGMPYQARFEAGSALSLELQVERAGTTTIETAGSDFDTVLELRTAGGAQIARDDDGGEGTTSRIRQHLEAGRYTVVVRGFNDTNGGQLALLATGEGAVSDGGGQDGSARERALPMTAGVPVLGSIEANGELWYAFELHQATEVVLSTEGSDFDTVLHLHDAAGTEITSDDDGGNGTASRIARPLTPGRWFVRVRGFGNNSGNLFLEMSAPTTASGTGTVLRVGESLGGQLAAGERLDVHFEAPAPGTYTFHTNGSSFDTFLHLYDADGNEIASDDDGGEGTASRVVSTLPAGRYRLQLRGFSDQSSGDWSLSAQSDGGSAPAPTTRYDGTSRDSALRLSGEQRLMGALGREESRWFRLTLDGSAALTFSTEGSDFDTLLRLEDEHGTELASDDDGGSGTTSRISQSLPAGTYYVELTGFGGSSGSWVLEASTPLGVSAGTTLEGDSIVRADFAAGERLEFQLHSTGGEWTLSTEGSTFDTVLELDSLDGQLSVTDDDGGPGTTSRIQRNLPAGDYTVTVRGFSETSAGQLVLSANSGAQASTNSGANPGSTRLSESFAGDLEAGEQIWHDFQVGSAQEVVLSTANSDFDTVLTLNDSSGNQLATDDDGGPGTTSEIRQRLEQGAYRVQVRGFGQNAGHYILTVNGSGTSGPGVDALHLGENMIAELGSGEVLTRTFHAARPGRYTFSTAGSNFDTVLRLLDDRGNQLGRDDDGGEGLTSLIQQRLAPGAYTLEVSAFGEGSGRVVLTATNGSGHGEGGPDGPAIVDGDGSSRDTASLLSGDYRASGNLSSGAERWHSVLVLTPAVWEFSTGGSSFDTVLALYDPDGEEAQVNDDGGSGTASLIRQRLTPGLWTVRVTGYAEANGAYELSAEAFSSLGLETLTLGQTRSDELQAGQELEFELVISEAGVYTVHTEGSAFDTVLSLHDFNGEQLARDDDGGSGTTSRIGHELEPGSYLVRLRGFSSGSAGSYQLIAQAGGAVSSDGNGGNPLLAPSQGTSLAAAQAELELMELEIEDDIAQASDELELASYAVEEAERALIAFGEHRAPLETARAQLDVDRAMGHIEQAEAEIAALQQEMARNGDQLPSLHTKLRGLQRELEFARREAQLNESAMALLVEIELPREERSLEHELRAAQAMLRAAERAYQHAELRGATALEQARARVEALSIGIEAGGEADSGSLGAFEYSIF